MTVLGALAAALMVAGALVAIVGQAEGDTTTARRSEIVAYEKKISGPARDAGFVVQEGLKPGLADVAAGQPGPVVFSAVTWVDRFRSIGEQFAAAADGLHDGDLRRAAELFESALKEYERTAETIGAAAIASGEPRQKLLEKAAAKGRHADQEYDKASAHLQRARRSVGLPPTARFPDPSEGET